MLPQEREKDPERMKTRPRWTLGRLVRLVFERLDLKYCRETIRKTLKKLGFSWKKGKKLLNRASPAKRAVFVEKIKQILKDALDDKELLVYMDEAHVHQDADLGYGWSISGERLWVSSSCPGKSKVTFYGLYFYNEGRVRIWDYDCGNNEYTIRVLRRLRKEYPTRIIRLIWDGAPYHRSAEVIEEAEKLKIILEPLPAYSPDFMPVEALWRWLREDVTYNYCHHTNDELRARVSEFEQSVNSLPNYEVADRLWVKDSLHPEEEKLRFSI